MRRRLALPLAASLVVHALALSGVRSGCGVRLAGPGAAAEAPAPVATAAAGVAGAARARAEALVRGVVTRRAREALVAEARADRAAGRLALGRFLLRAGAIDAEALGEPLDLAEAEGRYAARLSALREALRRGPVSEAVPEVFEDLRYVGQPGGLMAEALLEGGGSCEQIAQLVAATVYDAGRGGSIALRYYGGVMADGAAHIAPIALEDGDEHDLMSGKPAVRRGVRFPAEMLVEAYARAHGLAPPMDGAPAAAASPQRWSTEGAEGPMGAASARPTLIAGMPPNRDRYPGTLPLYAARAVQAPGGGEQDDAAAGGAPDDAARDCAYFVRMAALSPPSVEVALSAAARGAMSAEPRRRPEPWRLERQAALLGAAEALAREAELGDRLMGWACMAALGESAGLDLALAGERRLAAAAIARAKEARESAREALRGVRWEDAEGERLRQRLSTEFGGRTWLLLFIEGGERVVLDLVDRGRREDWGQVSALAALILWGPTRAEGLRRAEALPARDQIDVMHEVFHAHDHMRPWASNVALAAPSEDAGAAGAAFLRGYRVYRGVAFQLWEAHRPIGEILGELPAAARAAGLDAGWEAALIEYVGRNALGLYSNRPSGLGVVGLLKEAVLRSGHPSLDTLRRQLEYIEAQRRLDATTLADASRLR